MIQVADCFVELRGLRFHYRRWMGERSEAPWFVLVHGLSSSSHIWDLVAPQLAARHVVMAVDQRGHGETEQPDEGYEFESVADDLRAFVSAVETGSRLVLVGHSWGANAVLAYAARFPEHLDGVVLVDGGIGSPGERWSWEETLDHLTPPDVDGMRLDDLRRGWRLADAAQQDHRMEVMLRSIFDVDAEGRISRRFRIANHLKVLRALWEQRPSEVLRKVQVPVLVLPTRHEGDEPTYIQAKEIAAERARSVGKEVRVHWLEDSIHDVPLQRPNELAAEILQFADGVASIGRSGRE